VGDRQAALAVPWEHATCWTHRAGSRGASDARRSRGSLHFGQTGGLAVKAVATRRAIPGKDYTTGEFVRGQKCRQEPAADMDGAFCCFWSPPAPFVFLATPGAFCCLSFPFHPMASPAASRNFHNRKRTSAEGARIRQAKTHADPANARIRPIGWARAWVM
jgi:hypothetical protein